jgi:DNA recombination-mediator protein A/DprA winged helix domain
VAYRFSWFVGPQCPMVPRPQGNAALSAAVVVVEAAEDSGSLSTARAAGSRGAGHVLVLPGAPWDPGAAGCNQLIRDGATLIRSLTDILQELATTVSGSTSESSGTGGSGDASGSSVASWSGGASGRGHAIGTPIWTGLDPPARAVLTALIDGQLLTPGRLAVTTDLPPPTLDTALLDLELAGLIRRTTAGVQAIGLPGPPAAGGPAAGGPAAGGPAADGRLAPPPEARGPPAAQPAERRPSARVLEYGGSGGDDDGDDRQP